MAAASRARSGSVAAVLLARRFGQRPLGPRDGAGIVAGPKREPAHLLEQMRALDRIAVVAEPLEARREAGAGALAVARFPVQSADLPVQARGARAIAGRLDLLRAPPRSAREPRPAGR